MIGINRSHISAVRSLMTVSRCNIVRLCVTQIVAISLGKYSVDSKGNLTVLRLSLKQKKPRHEEILPELFYHRACRLFCPTGIYTD